MWWDGRVVVANVLAVLWPLAVCVVGRGRGFNGGFFGLLDVQIPPQELYDRSQSTDALTSCVRLVVVWRGMRFHVSTLVYLT
jgi:hypothetical protein